MNIVESGAFKRDLKRYLRQPKRMAKLRDAIILLVRPAPLPPKLKDHALIGGWNGFRECHIEPDFLLIYRKSETILELARLGSHSELF